MQLTSTTDYAIRIVCYLAAQSQMISTLELSQELSVPSSYIPKITKKLKQAGIIKACEGIKGGYQIAKQPENISLRDVISCTESTMAISRCLEKEGGCSRNYIYCCKVHQILLELQNIYNNRLESVKISDIIRPGKDEYFGRFYVVIKVNLREKNYECIYSHNHDVYEQVKTAESYDDFIKKYAEKYICEADWVNVQKCLAGENLTEHLVDGCVEKEIFYRGIIENNGTSYVWMKDKSYECVYSHIREVYEKVRNTESYEEFISQYVERYVYASDKKMVHDFLSSEGLEERLVDGCMEKDLPYRRITGKDENAYVWMEAKKYIDANENTAIITLHNAKIVQNTVIRMEQELVKKEQDLAKQYWDMVSLLTTVLNHNQLVEAGYQDDISFYTKQVYLQLQKNYPEYEITDEEITSVAHLAPIHDIGKIKVPIEILNKNGKLTDEEMNVVKQHPLVGAAMTQRFPEGVTTEKLNQYSYEICRHHHERYDGSGYPDGLKGNEIPICAQVVGIVDAYDALINDRPYKRKYEPEEAIRMISNGECGAFSKKLIQCLTAAAKQKNWLQRQN